MLRITVHRNGGQCRLELSGRLYGPWVGETETVWRAQRAIAELDRQEQITLFKAGELFKRMAEKS
jgi:hypothetical protein